MSWQEYGILLLLGAYGVAVGMIAPFLVSRGRHRSQRIRENYRQMLEQLRRSLVLCIGFLVVGAFILLPLTFLGGDRKAAALTGLIILVDACVFLLLRWYLSRLIADFEKNGKVSAPPMEGHKDASAASSQREQSR